MLSSLTWSCKKRQALKPDLRMDIGKRVRLGKPDLRMDIGEAQAETSPTYATSEKRQAGKPDLR